ncbi:hypothetical protein K32_18200 [Kaistia sp. 32K]|uniref:hypothetical protein n=1 Tax=Kaistia sp. 32K TaxID=2795690 RepID=UPI001916B9CB|nr:hypothetical protein [Kaistia sp. 32K]BCP53203.1 hypothetical protein K32_18200 [Kaistia sp. 32K]
MNRTLPIRGAVRVAAVVLGLAALFLSENPAPQAPAFGLFSRAEAIIGRPLTPLSYAGVARRTTRRAVVGGAYVGGAYVAAPYAVAPRAGCVRVVDAYGRIYWRCV